MQVFEGSKGGLIKAWVEGVPFEDAARAQIENVASMPFIHSHIAVMPDVHHGKGATIGTVIATDGAIIPAAVGVDIGCGMMAQKTTLRAGDLPDDLSKLRALIEEYIPAGRTDDGGDNDRGSWGNIPALVCGRWAAELRDEYEQMISDHPRAAHRRPVNMLGSLGSGNHFVEVCLDEDGYVWVVLHSGSRGPGARIGNYFIELAKKDMERYFINLPDKDLAYLVEGTEHFAAYRRALAWAQKYARINREIMMDRAMRALWGTCRGDLVFTEFFGDIAVNCHHNYVNEEKHFGKKVLVTRKGAVRAKVGDLGIIPGSMGAKSYIVEGLGNRDSFETCSHGAGRRMSRRAAERQFTETDLAQATAGVECRKDAGVIDEIPMAYKDIDAVMAAQADLVRIKHTLKQVLCVKG